MVYFRIKVPNGYLAYSGFNARFPWFPKFDENTYAGYFTTQVVMWNGPLNASVTDFPGLAIAFKSKDEEVMAMVRTFCVEAKWVKVVARSVKIGVGKRTGKRKVKDSRAIEWIGGLENGE